MDAKSWTVPAARMKAGIEHVVPLSGAALGVLSKVRPDAKEISGDLIFGLHGVARSNMAMAMLLRRMDRCDLTTHGFRSTFRDWAGDATDFPRDLAEMALAHAVANKTEAAYRRQRAVAKRRVMMDAWARYVTGELGQISPR